MKKSMKAGALLVAGVFALSGCGSSDESAAADSPTSASPTPTLAVGQEQYTADELLAALTAVKAAKGLTGEVSDDATLRPSLAEATDAPEGVTLTPATCGGIAGFANFFGPVDDANVSGLETGDGQKLTLVSHTDASILEQQTEENNSTLEECAEFEMAGDGMVAEGTAERLDISTEAPTTLAFTFSLAAYGNELSGMKVSAASGTTNIVVTNSDASDPAASSAQATELIDAVLAELEK